MGVDPQDNIEKSLADLSNSQLPDYIKKHIHRLFILEMELDINDKYSSSNSELPMEERIRKSLVFISKIVIEKSEHDRYVNNSLLDYDHLTKLSELPVYLRLADQKLKINHKECDNLLNEYEQLQRLKRIEESNYDEEEYIEKIEKEIGYFHKDQSIYEFVEKIIEEVKWRIEVLKIDFRINFYIKDDLDYSIPAADYKLSNQKISFITDRHEDPIYEKYFSNDLKDLIAKWITDAGLPLNDPPIDLFKPPSFDLFK